ncbi:MAG TPA: carboxypeptidase regulatory-like domain-containing protein, partial [Acidimicrobiales bacterium]|nr:carboxypeptidase regulatory-like domain-containing protein [Acidimicrobiales bacterium]
MSRPGFGPSASLTVSAPAAEAAPGQPCRIPVTVTNVGDDPTPVSLTVVGIDPAWVAVPDALDSLAPGSAAVFEVVITVPLGHPAAGLAASVVAGDGAGTARSADLSLTIADGSVVAATIEPPETRGGRRGRAHVVLRNRGRAPVRVDIEPVAPEPDLHVRVSGQTQVLGAGQEVRVPARLSAPRPLAGAPRRRAYGVRVRTPGTPLHVEAAFTQRPLLPSFMSKGLIIAVVVALWAAVAVVGITDLNHHLSRSATERAANNNPPVSTAAGPSGGSGAGSGGSGGGGSGGSGGGSAAGGGGSSSGGGSAAGGSGSSAGSAGGGSGTAGTPSRLSGKVAASQPGGVTVTVAPTSLSSQAAQTATLAASVTGGAPIELASASFGLGKLFGPDLPVTNPLRTSVPSVDSLSTTTNADGSWAIASISTPGYYLVSFSKPGYATANYVVNVTGNGKPVVLQSRLVPGDGALSGLVSGPSGPLGGAQITITDGTVNLTTRTPTVGATGTWALQGLTTPDTYLVTATLPGYSTQTTLVTLGAGGHQAAIDLQMVPGQGSVSGTVVSSATSQPVGGLTVSVSNGSLTRTTTTTTTGAVGTYALPDLPAPGTYALTVSGPGIVAQTQQVGLQAGSANVVVNATVTPSTGDVTGVATDANGRGLAGAGAVLADQTDVFKTLTTSGGTVGSFDFGNVPPGQYVLSVQDFGYLTQSAQVTVGPGQTQTVSLSLPAVPPASIDTATIQGSVRSLATSQAVTGAQIDLDGQPTSVTTDASGAYTINKVGPGNHTVTAVCPTSTSCQSFDLLKKAAVPGDFETTDQQVTVAEGSLTFAAPILMPTLDQLAGMVVDTLGNPVANPVVQLTSTATGQIFQPTNPPVASGADAPHGGFEFDNLPHGTYTLTIQGPNTTGGAGICSDAGLYHPYTNAITLAPDTNYLLTGAPGTTYAKPALTIGPAYRVDTEIIPSGSSTPVLTKNVTVTVTGVPGTLGALFAVSCAENTTQPVVQLPNTGPGAMFTASFRYTDPSTGTTYTAPTTAPFPALDNSSLVNTAILVPPAPDVTVSLQFPWRTPAGVQNCPVSDLPPAPGSSCPALAGPDLPASVTVSGQVTQPGGTTQQGSFTATTSGAGAWTIPGADMQGLVPGSVTVRVAGGAFQAQDLPTTTTALKQAAAQMVLVPNPVSVAGTVASPGPGTAIAVAPAEQGESLSTSSTSQIVWQEPGLSAGLVYPGVYNVTFSHGGYDSLTVGGFTVNPCLGACYQTLGALTTGPVTPATGSETYAPGSDPISLTPHFQFDIKPVYSTQQGLPYPTVTLTTSGATIGSQTLSATTTDAIFSDLSVTAAPYVVTVSGAGFQTLTTSYADPYTGCGAAVACQNLPTTGGTVSAAPAPPLEGYLTGTVDGVINASSSPLAGATVTATPQPDAACSAASLPILTGKTDTNGNFVLTNSSASDGGVCVGATYAVVAQATGYASSSAVTAVIAAGDNAVSSSSAPITLKATQVSQAFTVLDSLTGKPVAGVAITATSAIGGPITVQSTKAGSYTVTADPTKYTFSFSETGYAPFGETITYYVGQAPPAVTVTLTFDTNTVNGYVTTPGTCSGSTPAGCPLKGATVDLIDPSNPGTPLASGSTDSSGRYSFAPPTYIIPDGSYLLQASLSGYQYSTGYQQSFSTSATLTTEKDVSLSPTPVQLTVTVTANLAGASLTGASVSLTPAAPPTQAPLSCTNGATVEATGDGSSQTASVSGSGTASLPSVAPDYYDLTVTGTGIPAQQASGLLVCPGVTAASFEVMAGQVTGTISAPAGSRATSAVVSLTTPGGTVQSPVISCTSSDCSTGQFTSDLESLGSGKYSLAVSATGYQAAMTTPAQFQLTAASPTHDAGTVTLTYQNVPVTVTVGGLAKGQTVTVSLESGSGTIYDKPSVDKTGSVFSFSVPPDPSNSYLIFVADTPGGVSVQEGSIYVPVGSAGVSANVAAPPPT